jgi:hypothetical protein
MGVILYRPVDLQSQLVALSSAGVHHATPVGTIATRATPG